MSSKTNHEKALRQWRTVPTGLEGRRVLLTGATGFIGRHLAGHLNRLGAQVHGISRRPAANIEAPEPSVTWHRADLADRRQTLELYERVKPSHVFHLASHVAGSRGVDLVHPTLLDNLCSTVHLLEAAERHGCERFVQVGSLEEPTSPAEPPSSPYAAAKAGATAYCRLFHHLYDLPVVIARVFMVYGPGRQDERKLVPYVIRSLIADETPSFSSGTRPVDWVFVDDVAEGFVRLAVTEGLDGHTVDLGTGKLHTVREMVEALFLAAGDGKKPSFGGLADRASEQVRKADAQRTEELLAWRPSTPLIEGVKRTVAWFRDPRVGCKERQV